ncbi:ATP-binding protein [Streptomyces sp. H39-S7]|uniref:ATP-binding protein n=1 Tax=Streptomyces sp. H39-S7 TaxID=3004357 RepID=UPI0022AFC619|nr:ATP-binding protein [Streptomyces sp. H39-S7]MCZ4125440.1 ATP-binding protein [Streptomyces sp. H39-S7]
MKLPIRHVAGNVCWTTHGTAWGIWRVSAANYAHASATAKKARLRTIEAFVKALPTGGEPILLSLCPQVDPRSVVRAMTADVDLERSLGYQDLADRVLTQLESMELSARTDWLAVPLPAGGRIKALADLADATRAGLALTLGLVPAGVSASEQDRRIAQAAVLAATWPSGVGLRPATEAEILWMYGHAARRGTEEPLLPAPGDEQPVLGRGRGVAALAEVLLAEGGRPRDEEQQGRRLPGNPFANRHLQVTTEWGTAYQAMLALAQMPKRFAFPGSEYLASLDNFDFPIDWTCRLAISSGATALRRTKQRARNIAQQDKEYEHEPAGVPPAQVEAVADLAENRERLASSHTEVDIRSMVTLCVWGPTPAEAHARAEAVQHHFGGSDYTLARPVGEQENLWYAMLPGTRAPRVLASYAQYLLARDWAMAMPWCGAQLGDDSGPLYGVQLTGGGERPVLVDFSRGPAENASACAAFIGELGAGKSVALKSAMFSVLAAGRRVNWPGSRGRVVVVDRTEDREWERFARACPGTTQVITVDDSAEISLDPLRIFAPEQRSRRTKSFLTLLLGIKPMDIEGVVLTEAIKAVLSRDGASMQALTTELAARGAHDATASVLARKLAAAAEEDLARVIFDPSLPPIATVTADSVVFSVSSLQLPKKSELESEFRMERMETEKIIGRALMYLVAALCREITFGSKDEFAVSVWDECWWLTSSPEGQELLLEQLRDGRKHRAGALLGTHDSYDIGPADSHLGAVLRGLIPHRFLFRQTDETLAMRGLEFLGLDSTDRNLVDLVTTGLSPMDLSAEEKAVRAGECLYRDLNKRIGTMRVLLPSDPKAQEQIHSTPGRSAA